MIGIHRSPVDFPNKDQRRGALILSVICARTNDWANNRDACDLKRHRTHYDITVKWEEVADSKDGRPSNCYRETKHWTVCIKRCRVLALYLIPTEQFISHTHKVTFRRVLHLCHIDWLKFLRTKQQDEEFSRCPSFQRSQPGLGKLFV